MNATTQPPQGVMAELRELLARATPGPWRANLANVHTHVESRHRRIASVLYTAAFDQSWSSRDDAALIVAAVNALPGLLARCEGLEACRLFARDVLDSDRRYSIDGADVESLAQKHGLLAEREVTESCGEDCVCADYGFPQKCLRFTDKLAATRTTGD